METPTRKRGRPRVIKVEERSPQPEDLEEMLQNITDEEITDYVYIPNGIPEDYVVINKNKKNINNNEDVYDFDVEKEDGPGISNLLILNIIYI